MNRVHLDLHGLIFETSICYWQDQPGSLSPERTASETVGGRWVSARPHRRHRFPPKGVAGGPPAAVSRGGLLTEPGDDWENVRFEALARGFGCVRGEYPWSRLAAGEACVKPLRQTGRLGLAQRVSAPSPGEAPWSSAHWTGPGGGRRCAERRALRQP